MSKVATIRSDKRERLAAGNAGSIGFAEPDDFAASLTGFDTRYLPTTSDRRFSKLELPLESGCLVVVKRPPMFFEGAVAADHGVVTFQLDDDLKASVNGSLASKDSIVFWNQGTGYRGYQQSRLTHCSLFLTDAFAARDWPAPTSGGRMLRMGTDGAGLRACVKDVTEVIRGDPVCMANPHALKGMDQSIMGYLDRVLYHAAVPFGSLASGRHQAICRRAEEYLRNSRFCVHSNVDVANACGVQMRTLHNAFVSVLGISLGRYLLLHRLRLVRNALLRAHANDLVKSIALDHGFWHLGRFSMTYYSTFGEWPSETLAKRTSVR